MRRQNGKPVNHIKVLALFSLCFVTFLALQFDPEVKEKSRRMKRGDQKNANHSLSLVQWFKDVKTNPTKYNFHTDVMSENAIKFTKDDTIEAIKAERDENENYDGWAQIQYSDGSFAQAHFTSGILNGLFLRYQCKFGACDQFELEAWRKPNHLKEISIYKNGIRTGISVRFKIGGGFVIGRVNAEGELTGDNISYIYPDYQTMIVGQFKDGILTSGQFAELVDLERTDHNFMKPLYHVKPNAQLLAYWPSNQTFIPQGLIRDAMEDQFIYVSNSTLDGAGRGVFMKRAAKKGSVVAFYNGVRMTDIESKVKTEDRKSPYRMDNDWR